MKKLIVVGLLAIASSATSTGAFAQLCGSGTVVDMKEGGWNEDGVAVQLSGPNARPGGADLRSGSAGPAYVYFSASTLNPQRLEGIRRIASLAVATGKTVWTYSHTGSCENATEISILSP